jgi:hypothetical protein
MRGLSRGHTRLGLSGPDCAISEARSARFSAQMVYDPNRGAMRLAPCDASGLGLHSALCMRSGARRPRRSCSRVMAMTTFSIVFVATFVVLVVVIAVVLRRTVFRD